MYVSGLVKDSWGLWLYPGSHRFKTEEVHKWNKFIDENSLNRFISADSSYNTLQHVKLTVLKKSYITRTSHFTLAEIRGSKFSSGDWGCEKNMTQPEEDSREVLRTTSGHRGRVSGGAREEGPMSRGHLWWDTLKLNGVTKVQWPWE